MIQSGWHEGRVTLWKWHEVTQKQRPTACDNKNKNLNNSTMNMTKQNWHKDTSLSVDIVTLDCHAHLSGDFRLPLSLSWGLTESRGVWAGSKRMCSLWARYCWGVCFARRAQCNNSRWSRGRFACNNTMWWHFVSQCHPLSLLTLSRIVSGDTVTHCIWWHSLTVIGNTVTHCHRWHCHWWHYYPLSLVTLSPTVTGDTVTHCHWWHCH